MKKEKKLLLDTATLTASSFILRGLGLVFQVHISAAIGDSGVGLFQLIMSVQALAITLASSGIRYAVTRLVSEEIGMGRREAVRCVMRRCFAWALAFSTLAFCIQFFGAWTIGSTLVGDSRTVPSLRIISFGLPFLSMSAVMGGYFTAVQRAYKSAVVQLFEQVSMIVCVALLLPRVPTGRLELACAAIALGTALADLLSFLLSFVLYCIDRRRFPAGGNGRGLSARLIHMGLPLAMSAWARSALSTLQHLLVPGGLKRSGATADAALAAYGVVHGMVLPLLLFPSAFFISLAELLIPELTEAQMRGDARRTQQLVGHIYRLCLCFSVAAAAVFLFFGQALGSALYGSDAGGYTRLLAPLVIIMFMDTVTDGMLKGLGQQLHSMGINIADALLSVIMVYTLLPRWGIPAYLFTICFTETFNFVLSIIRLRRVTPIPLSLRDLLIPVLCSLAATNAALLLLRLIGLPLEATLLSALLHIAVTIVFYFALIRLIGYTDDRGQAGNGGKTQPQLHVRPGYGKIICNHLGRSHK